MVNGKPQSPGFIRLADLHEWTEWTYEGGSGAADVAQVMSPRADAPDEEVKAFVAKLRGAVDRVAGQPSEQRLQQQISDLEQMLKKREEGTVAQAAPGFPPGDTTSGDPTVRTERSRASVTPAQPQPAVEETPEVLLRRAKRMRDQHNLRAARAIAVKLLQKDPNSASARDLLKDIEELEKLDALTR